MKYNYLKSIIFLQMRRIQPTLLLPLFPSHRSCPWSTRFSKRRITTTTVTSAMLSSSERSEVNHRRSRHPERLELCCRNGVKVRSHWEIVYIRKNGHSIHKRRVQSLTRIFTTSLMLPLSVNGPESMYTYNGSVVKGTVQFWNATNFNTNATLLNV